MTKLKTITLSVLLGLTTACSSVSNNSALSSSVSNSSVSISTVSEREKIWELAKQATKQKDYNKAISILKPLAEKGDPDAQFNVGVLYDIYLDDLKQGIYWYQKAAEQGHADAQVHLSEASFRILGDYKTAFYWAQKAAQQGERQALYRLARFYHYGNDEVPVKADKNKAKYYYDLACKKGEAYACVAPSWLK